MAQGNIIKLAGEFTDDSLPRYYPNDPSIDQGTLFLFDVGKATSWPTLAEPSQGNTIINLVTGGPAAVVSEQAATSIGYRENGFDFTALTAGTNLVYFGSVNADFSLNALGNPDFLAIVWMKRETGFSTGNFQNVIGRGTNTAAANYEFYVNLGGSGDTLTLGVSNGTNGVSVSVSTAQLAAVLNTTAQFGFAFEGGVPKIFINGVLVATGSTALVKPFNPSTTIGRMCSGDGIGGPDLKAIIKRWQFNKLGFGKTAAQKVLADYNSHKVRLQTPA